MNKEAQYNKLLRIDEVLLLLPISRAAFYRGIQEGKYPKPVKDGWCSFWFRSDIQNIIAKLKEKRGRAT